MKPWEIIELLRSDNGKLFKQATISDNIDNEEFVEGLKYALTPLITYGVQSVPNAELLGEPGPGLDWSEFKVLLDKLIARELTGHAARDAIVDSMVLSTVDQWNNWYRPILLKDLKAGFSERTVNKVKKGTIPVFGCMLARKETCR